MNKQVKIFTIKEINRYIKMKLESEPLLRSVWIQGEISNFTNHSSGHMYFTLKDKDSRIKCVMFASQNRQLAFLPRNGSKVLANGQVSVFERDGQYQFYVNAMQPDGLGSLYLAYEQLKNKLEKEGLFDESLKKPIPRIPQKIGVITSPTGAAIRDILSTLERRFPAASVLIYPVSVQGKLAVSSIVNALTAMSHQADIDVIIVGRGGGSLEELWAFNEEAVARAIFAAKPPVISAVGHETDFTIADFVADVRAATPTAAAEMAVPSAVELNEQLQRLKQRLVQALMRYRSEPAQRLDRLQDQLKLLLKERYRSAHDRLMKLEKALGLYNPKEQISLAHNKIGTYRHQLWIAMNNLYNRNLQQYRSTLRHLDALSPLKVMQRGYSLVYDDTQQHLIKSVNQVKPGQPLKIKLSDGELKCQVNSLEGDEQFGG